MEITYKNKKNVLRSYVVYLLYVTAILLVFAYKFNLLIASVLWGIPGYGYIIVCLFIRHLVNRKNLRESDVILSEKLLCVKHPLGFYTDYHLSDMTIVKNKGKLLLVEFVGANTDESMSKAVIELDRVPSEIASEFVSLLEESAKVSKQSSEPVVSYEGTQAVIDLNALDDHGLQCIVDRLRYLSKQVVIDSYRIKYPSGVINRETFDVEELQSLLAEPIYQLK